MRGLRLFALLLLGAAVPVASQTFTCCTGSGCTGGVSNNPVFFAALGDLYYATSLSWSWNNYGWADAAAGTASDYCNFANGWNDYEGLRSPCDSTGALTNLDLGSQWLTGTIPQSLGVLTTLNTLVLSSNLFTGTIPATLGNLTGLTYLSVAVNTLPGSIPSTLGSLTALQRLEMDFNNISGSLPSTLGSLTALQHMHLFVNQLSGTLPPGLAALTALTSIDLMLDENVNTTPLRHAGNSIACHSVTPHGWQQEVHRQEGVCHLLADLSRQR